MDHHPQRREYTLEVFADQTYVKDIVKGVLHMIFFHRYFPSIRPSLFPPSTTTTSHTSRSSNPPLPLPLPAILDPPEIDSLVESRTQTLIHQLTSSDKNAIGGGVRGDIAVQFFDRKRRKPIPTPGGGWLGRLGGGGGAGAASADEEICWEEWVIEVVVARPRTEADRIKVRRAMESSLQKTAMKILAIVNRDKDHIPPITTSETNPFPYRIVVNPKQALAQQGLEGYGAGLGHGGGRAFSGWG